MDFRTVLTPASSGLHWSYNDRILMLGSCFAENMGARLLRLKYRVCLNPFGTLYNPSSMAQSIEKLLNPVAYSLADVFEEQGVWANFDFHSRFAHSDKSKYLQIINAQLAAGHEFVQTATRWVLTLGTAWIYELLETGQTVNNCHKVPARCFARRRLSVSDVVERLGALLEWAKLQNPNLRILLSVSPIRHVKDGLVENQLSKSTLVVAAHELRARCGDWVEYFPAYELLMDDLRDYRFYASDMVHPSDVAIEYIWNAFESAILSPADAAYRQQIERLQRAIEHRPFNPQTPAHQQFIQKNLLQIDRLQQALPLLDFASERERLAQQLI